MAIATSPDRPTGFGYKCMWFTVKTVNTQQVAHLLQLKKMQPCNWASGIELAYKKRVFVAPPVDGWTFVVGWGLPSPGATDDDELIQDYLKRLSKQFGEAQYFCTHRVSEVHCWMKAVDGRVERLYCYADGDTQVSEGKPTEAEGQYNFYDSSNDDADFETANHPDEELVMEIAGRWSVNPNNLDERKDLEAGVGIIATAPSSTVSN